MEIISPPRNKKSTPNFVSVGEKIRFFRLRSEMSQLELEANAELSPGTISKFENSVINPTKETLFKIGEVLNLDSKELAYLFEVNLYKQARNS